MAGSKYQQLLGRGAAAVLMARKVGGMQVDTQDRAHSHCLSTVRMGDISLIPTF